MVDCETSLTRRLGAKAAVDLNTKKPQSIFPDSQ